jgi:hypothetical protein
VTIVGLEHNAERVAARAAIPVEAEVTATA